MKKYILIIILCVGVLGTFIFWGKSGKENHANDILKVLLINDNDSLRMMEQDLYELAKTENKSIIVGHLVINDSLLKNLMPNNIIGDYSKININGEKLQIRSISLAKTLLDESWDYISISSKLESEHGTEIYDNVNNYLKSQSKVTELVTDQYSMTAISNVSTVLNRLCIDEERPPLYQVLNRYTAACAWFEILTQQNAEGSSYSPEELSTKFVKAAQKAAHIAVICPNQVVRQINQENPQEDANYDEKLVPDYVLPDPLKMADGTPVNTIDQWVKKRRPELLHLFETEMFGKAPEHPADLHFKVLTEDRKALNGIATRKEVVIYFSKDEKYYVTLLMYIPNKRSGTVPLFFGLNFKGNHTISLDPGISYPTIDKQKEFKWEKLPPRGLVAHRWPIEMLMEKGYALATIYNGDIDPDFDDNYKNGVHPLAYKEGQTYPAKNEWGTIAAWSWAMSCTMDYFETEKDIDASKVAVFGHSRNGKAALWAGATDQRFNLIISNESGCGGAALSRRCYGERVRVINSQFTHWFCRNFWKYNDKEYTMPFDQHQLIALLAPRPVYIASASGDQWADPKGEFLSGVHATPVYKLFGLEGLKADKMPEIEQSKQEGTIAYHIRAGKHEVMPYDWEQYVKFADKWLK